MRTMGASSAIVRLALPFCLLAASAQGATYYVALAGDDANPGGSPKLAWRTIAHAADVRRPDDCRHAPIRHGVQTV